MRVHLQKYSLLVIVGEEDSKSAFSKDFMNYYYLLLLLMCYFYFIFLFLKKKSNTYFSFFLCVCPISILVKEGICFLSRHKKKFQ